jgi:SAM-dependent methyltransferase
VELALELAPGLCFCTGSHPGRRKVRILDAGCGSGVGTEYIAHQNPNAEIWAFDLSSRALEIAEARCRASQAPPVQFCQLNVYDIDRLPGQFDFINCVGMLHHLPDPVAGLQALASKLAPGGILHLFVYGELGRHEIRLMQKAIRLLVTGSEHQPLASPEQLQKGLQVGRRLFEILPASNRIQQQEQARWALENVDDECFADMYLHPQEVDYNIETLFELIRASGLQFLRFSNPEFWRLERVLGQDEALLAQAAQLPELERYRLIELLDPVVAHYELFLGRPPLPRWEWTSPEAVASAVAHLSPCLGLWPGRSIFNYAYEAISLGEEAFAFLQQVDGIRTVQAIQESLASPLSWSQLQQLLRWQVLLLEPQENGF